MLIQHCDDVRLLRELFGEYAAELDISLEFQAFALELRTLPGPYRAPSGAALIAIVGDTAAGCVALRRHERHTAEMKRLYVRPAFRSAGVGRLLVEAACETARTMGYDRLVLDTLSSMHTARALYRSIGFVETRPHYESPVAGTLYLERTLRAWRHGGHD